MEERGQNQRSTVYAFGDFRLETEGPELWQSGTRVPLPQKALELLVMLLERRGRTVTKEEMLNHVWPDTFVDENNLAVNIAALRRVFGVKATDKAFIETIARRGYRFNAPVTELRDDDLLLEKRRETSIEVDESFEDSRPKLGGVVRRPPVLAIVISLLVIVAGALFVLPSFRTAPETRTVVQPRTIAVLPFKDTGPETNDVLSTGLTDALTTQLSKISGLAVRSTNSLLNNAALSYDDAIRKLDVESYLEGTVQREGERVRVSVRLVRASDGSIIWADSFDEDKTDLLSIQDTISSKVASELSLRLSDSERTLLASRPTEDREAYREYLYGRHHWNKRTPDGLNKSIRHFQQAIDRDPAFALAYAGLADSYSLLSEYNVAPPAETFPKARAAALKALEIDPTLAEARTAHAYVLASYEWKFDEAEREYRRAIELSPRYATAHQWYGELLMGMKRFDEAERAYERAAEIDPLSPIISSNFGLLAYYRKDYEGAIVKLRKTIDEFPTFVIARLEIVLALEQVGRFDEAADQTIEALRLSGLGDESLAALRSVHVQSGYQSFLRALLAGADAQAAKGYVPAFVQAFYYARLRDGESTLVWLEKAFVERHRYVAYINGDPNFDFMRDDPRFRELLRKVGFPS